VRGARLAEKGGRDAEHRNEEAGRRRMKALIPTLSHRGREKSGDVERPGGNSNAWASDPGDAEKVVGWRRRQVASPGPSPPSGREGSGGPEGEGGAGEQDCRAGSSHLSRRPYRDAARGRSVPVAPGRRFGEFADSGS